MSERKPIVVSGVPKERLDRFGVSWPEDWDVSYTERIYTPEYISKAEYLLVRAMDPLTAEMIDSAPNLKCIHTDGVSFNLIDIDHAASKGIMVCNCKGGNAISVAEHTVGLVLDCVKHITHLDRKIRRDGYKATSDGFMKMMPHEIGGLTVGMVGMGAIGREVLKRLVPWGAKLIYYDPYPMPAEMEAQYGVTHVELDELCKTADVITVHLPVIPSTLGMFDKPQFDIMKDGVILINVARGQVVVKEPLMEALESGRVGYYGADVFWDEPMPDDDPFLHMSESVMDRVVMTTHGAGRTTEAFGRMLEWAAQAFVDYENGIVPKNVVNGVTELK
ncbi:MAG: hypothetical protein IJH91_01900 [Mogibacterium sp.]|nr:hypothetical protein [Mogibacterium sp.]